MLEFKAASFYGVTSALHALRHKVESGQLKSMQDTADGGLLITFETDQVIIRQLTADAEELRANLKTLGANLALISAEKLVTEISGPNGFTWESIRHRWEEIHFRLLDELTLTKIFVLGPQEAACFAPADPLFGADFAAKFQTQGVFELDEAAKCMALSRPTAAVFHLMRVMEVGIRAVARCLGIPDPLRPADRSWGSILKNIRQGIDAKWQTVSARAHGDGALFDSLYASLDAVKNPWRNTTMHVEDKKTDSEAEMIFVAVKSFMTKLASRCDENGDPKA